MAEIKEIKKFHIFSAAYMRSAVGRSQYTGDGKQEIAFLGRSNVGKSSLTLAILSCRIMTRI